MASVNSNGAKPMYRQLLKAWSTNNNFSFHRDFVKIMTKMEALFIQDIINLATLDKAHYKSGWFQCTAAFLKGSLGWTDKEQKRLFKSLKDKGYIQSCLKGIPATRYIKIDVQKIAEQLEALEDKEQEPEDSQLGPKGTNWRVPEGTNRQGPNGTIKNNTIRITQKEKHNVARGNNGCTGFFDQPEKRTPEYILASKLDHILRTKEKELLRETHLPSWAKHFRKLLNHRTEDQIDAMLDWYNQNIDNDWCPQKYAAKTFCEDYPKLEEARKRFAKKERDREYQEALANQFN